MQEKEKKSLMNKKMKTILIVGAIIVLLSIIITVIVITRNTELDNVDNQTLVSQEGTTIKDPIILTIPDEENSTEEGQMVDTGQGNVPEEVETYTYPSKKEQERKTESVTRLPFPS